MKKSILDIEGVQILNKEQQTKIKAGSSHGCGSSLACAILDWLFGDEE